MKYPMTGRGNKFVFADHCHRQLGTSGSRKLQVKMSNIYKKNIKNIWNYKRKHDVLL